MFFHWNSFPFCLNSTEWNESSSKHASCVESIAAVAATARGEKFPFFEISQLLMSSRRGGDCRFVVFLRALVFANESMEKRRRGTRRVEKKERMTEKETMCDAPHGTRTIISIESGCHRCQTSVSSYRCSYAVKANVLRDSMVQCVINLDPQYL